LETIPNLARVVSNSRVDSHIHFKPYVVTVIEMQRCNKRLGIRYLKISEENVGSPLTIPYLLEANWGCVAPWTPTEI
jgi:hypothetical protein